MGEVKLPRLGKNGMYEMRLESIGGLGANVCVKLLGELGALYLGLEAAAFSSYGSEKQGAPVTGHVRFAEKGKEILLNSPVENPQLLALFQPSLAGQHPVLAGAESDCTLVVNSGKSPEEIREWLQFPGRCICCVDALRLADEHKSRLNMVMLGAIVRSSGFLPLEAAEALVDESLGKKYPDKRERNRKGLQAGYAAARIQEFAPDGRYPALPYRQSRNPWGYENAPLGGVNPHRGSTAANDVSASRMGWIPLFQEEKCVHCGLCDISCPDMVFQFLPGEYKGKPILQNRGLDYHHCKGCLRCVEICPTGALVAGREEEHPEKKYFVRNKDLIVEHLDFEVSGADPSISGEAHFSEKRVDGGLM